MSHDEIIHDSHDAIDREIASFIKESQELQSITVQGLNVDSNVALSRGDLPY
jgi:hypothetical protein